MSAAFSAPAPGGVIQTWPMRVEGLMTVLVWISLPILTPVSLIVMTLALQRWEVALLPPAAADVRSAGVIVEEFGRAPRVPDAVMPLLAARR